MVALGDASSTTPYTHCLEPSSDSHLTLTLTCLMWFILSQVIQFAFVGCYYRDVSLLTLFHNGFYKRADESPFLFSVSSHLFPRVAADLSFFLVVAGEDRDVDCRYKVFNRCRFCECNAASTLAWP